jgi:hypothetical protein
MPTTLTVRDETTSGDTLREFALELLTERITVRELIRSRVYQEVQDTTASSRRSSTGWYGQPTPKMAQTASSFANHEPSTGRHNTPRLSRRSSEAAS